jgi:integrase
MKFTTANVGRLKLPAGKTDTVIWDSSLPGFGVRIRPTSKQWRCQYRVGRQQRSQSLGDVRKVELEAARKIARQIFARIELGADPGAERDALAAAQAAASLTLGLIIERYLDAKQGVLRTSTFTAGARYLRTHWAPLHKFPVAAVSRPIIAARLQEISRENGRMSARAARRRLSALFSWAMREGLCESNPVIATNDPGIGLVSRDRVLTDDEIRVIWRACKDDDFGRIVKLLLLTSARREEIGSLQWSECDLDAGVLTLPAARTKNKRAHELALSAPALEILASIPRRARDSVFGKRGPTFSGWSFKKAELDAQITELNSGRPLTRWTLHDLRRTAATRMAELGVQPHIIEATLNHAGHMSGVSGIYIRSTYANEKRQALALWADKLSAIVERRESNVLTLNPKRA